MKLSTFLIATWGLLLNCPGATPVLVQNASGYWEGAIVLPTTKLGVRVQLSRATQWEGTIDIPVQGLRGFKLSEVRVEGNDVSFGMGGIPGNPKFLGKLASSKNSIEGSFTQGGQKFPFKLDRKEPGLQSGAPPQRGVPGQGVKGFWFGTLQPTPLLQLRLGLEITNTAPGTSAGVMVSLDQGGAPIPITSCSEKGRTVQFETKSVGGSFRGTLSTNGSELAGEWVQSGRTNPLVFKRVEKAARLNRPQEPKPPYPHTETEVEVENRRGKCDWRVL